MIRQHAPARGLRWRTHFEYRTSRPRLKRDSKHEQHSDTILGAPIDSYNKAATLNIQWAFASLIATGDIPEMFKRPPHWGATAIATVAVLNSLAAIAKSSSRRSNSTSGAQPSAKRSRNESA
ncbi:hypothetical protein GGI17_000793 [Coemansia sp. S146]|nr:hypothetical protein GGI17_000793 [Coemansia sp. S146]